MSLLGSFDIGATGLTAQAMRLNVISSNIANVDSVSGPDGRAYRARQVVFSVLPSTNSAGSGVAVTEIRESREPFRREYRPGHPKADAAGYVDMPNVNPVEEMVNMISAQRSYQMNIEAMNVSRQLMLKTLDLGK
ncbi:flagellar basal body rod protein FlgC [Polynucleobacter sp. HIN8]|uniref:flagellar basal body rod protein FlgC n=1 Tax=Polynucleobacter sp. HIN8 TaxID=3047867 RepID=UPI002572BC4F|nr:flagellar basal body rod protein FlgC [Polynucleobacter sp. HIN8]BEI39565.1 flagellar basal body rod protein FlgC [Polynucleobacter sp. HIN8]